MAIQYFTDQDLNGNRTRDAGDALLPQDYVTLAQLQAAVSGGEGYSQTFGDGVATTIPITHNLGTEDLVVEIRELSSGDTVEMGVSTNGINAIDITATPAPASNAFRVTILPRA